MRKRAEAPPLPTLPTRFSGPRESPGFLLWRVSNAWQRRQREALQPFGLTHSQFVILATATWFGASEPLTQVRIADLSGIDPMTTSQVVRALEAASLLERREHPGDPRAKAIVVTAAGRERVSKALVVVEATDATFFEPVARYATRLLAMFKALDRGNHAPLDVHDRALAMAVERTEGRRRRKRAKARSRK